MNMNISSDLMFEALCRYHWHEGPELLDVQG